MLYSLSRTSFGLAVLAILITGCGGPKIVKINGKLLKNGTPMIVSEETYVTLSFIGESTKENNLDAKTYSAKFDQKSGTYSVELPAGNYRVMQIVALPATKEGKLNAPSKSVKSEKIYELTTDQELDLEASAK